LYLTSNRMKTLNPYKYLTNSLGDLPEGYKKLIISSYLYAPRLMLTSAFPKMLRGILKSSVRSEHAYKEFLEGSKMWGSGIIKRTKTNLIVTNTIDIPEAGHLVFLNHVNELDFPFDSYVINKPYLANQHIKSTYFAYWWMKAMGSQVFDNSQKRTISQSVKNLVKGLKKHSFVVYPEGQNTYDEAIKPLKKGMIKVSFDNKIPIYIAVKSGVSMLQKQSSGNTIGYRSYGVLQPENFATWEEYRDKIFTILCEEKAALDKEILNKTHSV
jgi:1-acyl-sn-glycerol-3-phosphate acyltransferase